MVLGRKARPPLRFSVSGKIVVAFVVVVALILIATTLLTFDYVNTKFKVTLYEAQKKSLVTQNARLVERGREKDQQLTLLSDKMRGIETTLERIEEMEGHVRVLSGMPTTDLRITDPGPIAHRIGDKVRQSDIAGMFSSASQIMDRMDLESLNLTNVAKYFAQRRSEILQIPNRWPLLGWVTSVFGMRQSPFTGKMAMHNGLDIAAPEGTVIRSPASGMVIFDGVRSGYGNVLVMRHGRGISTLYGHLSKSLVSEGLMVQAGTPIALVGNSGRSTGPHLHYEVRLNNIPVNPKRFLPEENLPEDTPPPPPENIPEKTEDTWPSIPVPAEGANTPQ